MKNAMTIISHYVEFKQRRKELSEQMEAMKRDFFRACREVAKSKSNIKIGDVLIVRREVKDYDFPQRIVRMEEELKAAKEAYKKKAEPSGVSVVWAVES